MNRTLRRVAVVALALVVAAGVAVPAAHASIPERTDAVPSPAIDPGFPIVTNGPGFFLPPQFVDFDLDGKTDIIAVDNLGTIYAVGAGGQSLGGWPHSLGEPLCGPPVVGDLDMDGNLDLVLVTKSGVVRAYRSNGSLSFAPKLLPGTPIGAPVLAELDNSGRLAILQATTDGKLYAIDSQGQFVAGWPVTGPGPAVGGAFTFLAGDNFPRVGYLASPGGAAIFLKSGAPDTQYSYNPGVPLGPAMPVSGARMVSVLSDIDHLYLAARGGQLYRFDPGVIGMGGSPTQLTSVAGDSIVDTPGMVDLNGDLVPELALRSLRGDTLSITVVDGQAGTPLVGFPRRYVQSAPGGTIVAADLGDGATPELIFNQGGDRVTCISSNGTLQWTLTGLPAVAGPAIGDLDGDGALDLAVATTDGRIVAYTLGNSGIGPRGVEWPNSDGLADHGRRHHLRDRASVRAQWPPTVAPASAFTTRPVFGDLNGDGLPEAIWSDYTSGKTFAWNRASGVAPGWPQTYANGGVNDAPAVGDVTGDGIFESVQSTSTGYLVWGDRNGSLGSLLVDSGKILTPPALADIDADGTLDVVVGSSSGRLYAVNLKSKTVIPGFPVTTAGNIALPPALGDVNGDGLTNIVVVANLRYIYAYGRTGGAPLAGWPRQFPAGSSLTQPILVPVAGNAGLAVAFGQ
ncbi:MAG: VCBS repeat-containing protein, partial [Candidatus Eisenbacteria bacterium]